MHDLVTICHHMTLSIIDNIPYDVLYLHELDSICCTFYL